MTVERTPKTHSRHIYRGSVERSDDTLPSHSRSTLDTGVLGVVESVESGAKGAPALRISPGLAQAQTLSKNTDPISEPT
jgi:hypothetical protein